jgi:hypothetical protein
MGKIFNLDGGRMNKRIWRFLVIVVLANGMVLIGMAAGVGRGQVFSLTVRNAPFSDVIEQISRASGVGIKVAGGAGSWGVTSISFSNCTAEIAVQTLFGDAPIQFTRQYDSGQLRMLLVEVASLKDLIALREASSTIVTNEVLLSEVPEVPGVHANVKLSPEMIEGFRQTLATRKAETNLFSVPGLPPAGGGAVSLGALLKAIDKKDGDSEAAESIVLLPTQPPGETNIDVKGETIFVMPVDSDPRDNVTNGRLHPPK